MPGLLFTLSKSLSLHFISDSDAFITKQHVTQAQQCLRLTRSGMASCHSVATCLPELIAVPEALMAEDPYIALISWDPKEDEHVLPSSQRHFWLQRTQVQHQLHACAECQAFKQQLAASLHMVCVIVLQVVIFVVNSQDLEHVGTAHDQLHSILGEVIVWLLYGMRLTCLVICTPVDLC
jgi:hypothetical protein